jgi:hypothetical protein
MSLAYPHITLVGRAAAVSLLLTITLSGCGETRRALGYDKAPPDEFTVVSRAPLSQPPDFTLRPPKPGAPRPQEGTTSDQARSALVGAAALRPAIGEPARGDASQGEQVLLTKAGAERANPNIRRLVDEETANLVDADKSFGDKILFWQEKTPPGEIVDASKEARRLQENSATGQPVTNGDTPQLIRRKKGWLDGIF